MIWWAFEWACGMLITCCCSISYYWLILFMWRPKVFTRSGNWYDLIGLWVSHNVLLLLDISSLINFIYAQIWACFLMSVYLGILMTSCCFHGYTMMYSFRNVDCLIIFKIVYLITFIFIHQNMSSPNIFIPYVY